MEVIFYLKIIYFNIYFLGGLGGICIGVGGADAVDVMAGRNILI
jgi:hypothetical protein